ncbi:MAG: putative Ig domain-containing protein [Terriglobales bacterium]
MTAWLGTLAGCGGYSAPAAVPVAPVAANFLITSSSANGRLPTAIAGSPYAYGIATNLGQPDVIAVPPVTFSATAALPPGLTISSSGAITGTPTQVGQFPVSVQAVDSSPTPLTAEFTWLMNVTAPGATLTEVAHSALGGRGQNGDIHVATASATQVAYAYVGTLGGPGNCPATGVKVVSLSAITNPQVVATVGGVAGAGQPEARVAVGISSPTFHAGGKGDLMAVAEQPCAPGNPGAGAAGAEFYDVTDPTHPALLGTWLSGGAGVGDVAIVPVPGPVNPLGGVDHSQDKLYALIAVPESEAQGGEGDLRVVDITNPATPQEVGNWGVLAATGIPLPESVQGADPRVFLAHLELSQDLKTAYLSYFDQGVVVLDVSQPLAIRSANNAVFLNHIVYPITAAATTSTPSQPEGNTYAALPVMNDSELLIADQVCASAMTSSASNPAQPVPANPAVPVVCGTGTAVPLTQTTGWGFFRSYDLPSPATAAIQGFYVTPGSVSDPAPDRGIYTAHSLAWNGSTSDPHAYVAWYSSGVVDLDISSLSPPVPLAAFVPPDTPDPNGTNPAVNNPAKALVDGVAAYTAQGQPYILASDINSGLWVVAETPANQLTILTSALPNSNVGVPYFAQLTAVNGKLGSGRVIFGVAGDSNPLPSGLNLDGQGNITGTAAVAGQVNVTFTANDSAGNSTAQIISMTVVQNLAVVPPVSVPLGTTGEPYTLTLTAVNGTAPYQFSVAHSALPSGMSLSTAGVITGTPVNGGTFTPTIAVSDSSVPPVTATLPLTLQIEGLTVRAATPPAGSVGVAYADTVLMANGTGPFSPIVVSGSLPPGLTATTGTVTTLGWVVNGTPTAAGVYNFSVRITDADSQSVVQPFTIVINPFEITPPVLTSGVEGRGYLATLSAQGGTPPYQFNLVTGVLPPGLSLDFNAGTITGVPAAGSAGSYALGITVKDANGLTATQSFTLVIFSGQTFAVTTSALPPAQVGQSYQQNLTADFGVPPYAFTLLSGSLPAGLTLASNGALAGVPGAGTAGTYPITIQATDNTGNRAVARLSLTVLPVVSVQ